MDKLSIMLKVIASLYKGAKTIKELSEELELDVDVIKDIVAFDLKAMAKVLGFWEIKLYDEEGNELDRALDELYCSDDEDICLDKCRQLITENTTIEIWIDNIKSIDILNRYERFCLYELLKDSDKQFIKNIKDKITSKLDAEFISEYTILKDRRLVKHYNDIFNIDIELINKIFGAINNRRKINIIKAERSIEFVSPLCLVYDNDTDNWYLEYFKRGINHIRLDNIQNIEVLDRCFRVNKGYKVRYKVVKIRVFDEKNAKDRAIRHLSRRNIIEIDNGQGYIDIKTKVYDLNLFKRWVRTLGPSCIILEPKDLRDEFKNRLEDWLKIYNGEG
ncbi:WYL domain-containing protein [Caloramator sp. ALD01]|uniref:WYL domain-containing protein n=1 Tax=Caloramator sp. ALD01 TaxID=1031288 RepID=UPI000488E655|nr:WYL domain-containing protein [Caloramator sp. ALD01]